MTAKTVSGLILEYFAKHPNEDLNHDPVVDWVTQEWLKSHSTPPRDPWRGIRTLHAAGVLIKVKKGIYRYDPDAVVEHELQNFTSKQKEEIFKRDNYRCVVCGLGRADGMEIQADHIIPRSLGGRADIDNGQTLCATHNFRKKNYKGTESGKRMFIKLYEAAKSIGDEETMKFCADVLETYERHNINGHIIWKA
jgi:hypothetical protein